MALAFNVIFLCGLTHSATSLEVQDQCWPKSKAERSKSPFFVPSDPKDNSTHPVFCLLLLIKLISVFCLLLSNKVDMQVGVGR